jgi:hypothetical protein
MLKERRRRADECSVNLPVDVNAHAHLVRDIVVLVGIFALVMWLLFRFASR